MSDRLAQIEERARRVVETRAEHYSRRGEDHFCEDYGCHDTGEIADDVLALVEIAHDMERIADYIEAEFREGDKAYQVAIIARAALARLGEQTEGE